MKLVSPVAIFTPGHYVAVAASQINKLQPFALAGFGYAYLPPIVKLIYQGHLHFMSSAPILKKCLGYRVAVEECCQDLVQLAKDASISIVDADSPSATIQYDAHTAQTAAQFMKDANVIWAFCDLVYFRPRIDEGKDLPMRLLEWYSIYFKEANSPWATSGSIPQDTILAPTPLTATQSLLMRNLHPPPADSPAFWTLICREAAIGRHFEALQLVRSAIHALGASIDTDDDDDHNPNNNNNEAQPDQDINSPLYFLRIAKAALLDCPLDDPATARIDGTWNIWQEECTATLEALSLKAPYEKPTTPQSGVCMLLRILGGDELALYAICDSWIQVILAHLTHAQNTSSLLGMDELSLATRFSLEKLAEAGKDPSLMESILIAGADGNPNEMVALCSQLGFSWHAAHLSDLLQKSGKLDLDVQLWNGVDLREYYILDLISGLEQRTSLWRVSIDYLSQCKKQGRMHMEQLLLRLPVESTGDTTLEKISVICRDFGLEGVQAVLQLRLGTWYLWREQYSAAAYWFGRCDDLPRCKNVVELVLKRAEMYGPGSFQAIQLSRVVEGIYASSSDACKAAFSYAQEYSEFQEEVEAIMMGYEQGTDLDRSISRALEIATKLIQQDGANQFGKGLGKAHWPVLLYDLMQVYQKHGRLVSYDQVTCFVEALEVVDVVGAHDPCIWEGLIGRLKIVAASDKNLDENIDLDRNEEAIHARIESDTRMEVNAGSSSSSGGGGSNGEPIRRKLKADLLYHAVTQIRYNLMQCFSVCVCAQ